jgi:hypothetical protein
MAYTTINKSTDHFNTKLYSGNGSTNAVTGIGFAPNFVWLKERTSTSSHVLGNTIQGTGKRLSSNTTDAEASLANIFTSFDSDGFTHGADNGVNESGQTYVSWNWKAGTTSGISTDSYSTITPTSYSFNATNGFSIVKYNGNGTAGAGVPHGLGVAPKMVWVKNLASGSTGWYVYHKSIGAGNTLALNGNDGAGANNTVWNGYNTDATNFYLGTNTGVNDNGTAHIAYCFAEKTGYSKIGKYKGNGSTDGTFVYTGFKPAFVLIKRTSGTDGWILYDTKRETFNVHNLALDPSSNASENDQSSYNTIDIISNGFKCRGGSSGSGTGTNQSGGSYIYMAFGQSLVGSNNVPCTAR